jgi:hypothetical protein
VGALSARKLATRKGALNSIFALLIFVVGIRALERLPEVRHPAWALSVQATKKL